MHAIFWFENLKGRDHSKDIGVDGKILYLREMVWEVVDRIHLAQERDQWRAVVNMVMKLRVPSGGGGVFLNQLSNF
jgi:hypothetical protein